MIFCEGRLAPVGRPFMTRIGGEGLRKVQFNEFSLPLASRAKLWVDHDREGIGDIGQFQVVIAHRGWFIGDFTIDQRLDHETAALIKPGVGLSIGCDIVRSEVDPVTGVEHVLEGKLTEVSITRTPMIPEAKIVRRWESSASASTSPAPPKPSPAARASTAAVKKTAAPARHIVRASRRPTPAEEDAELRRRLDFYPDVAFELVLENMKAELGYTNPLHTLAVTR